MSKLRKLLCGGRSINGDVSPAGVSESGKTNKNASEGSSSSEDLPSIPVNGNGAHQNGQQPSSKQEKKLARRKSHEARIKANEERRQEIL